MKIFVKARPGAKENKVIPPQPKLLPDTEPLYIVATKEKPIQDRANEAISKLLAEYFKVSRSEVKLISGANGRKKVFEIIGIV